MKIKNKKIIMFIPIVVACFILVFATPIFSKAFDSERSISGKIYEFKRNDQYILSEAITTGAIDQNGTALGSFSIIGDLEQSNDSDYYTIYTGNASFKYTVNSDYFKESKTNRFICKENKKSVDDITLDSKIGKGAVIVQASLKIYFLFAYRYSISGRGT